MGVTRKSEECQEDGSSVGEGWVPVVGDGILGDEVGIVVS